MSSGPDDIYKAQCEERDTEALQRLYASGPRKRRLATYVRIAVNALTDAKALLEEMDKGVKGSHGKSAFWEESETAAFHIQRLELFLKDIDRLGLDFRKAISNDHKHEYPFGGDDPDEGCLHCGYRQGGYDD